MIKNKTHCWLSILLFLLFSCTGCESHEHEKVEKTLTLAPRSAQSVLVTGDHMVRVNFKTELTSEERAKCKNQGVEIMYLDSKGAGERMRSATHGFIEVTPEKGKAKVKIQNLEVFPIKVKVSWQ